MDVGRRRSGIGHLASSDEGEANDPHRSDDHQDDGRPSKRLRNQNHDTPPERECAKREQPGRGYPKEPDQRDDYPKRHEEQANPRVPRKPRASHRHLACPIGSRTPTAPEARRWPGWEAKVAGLAYVRRARVPCEAPRAGDAASNQIRQQHRDSDGEHEPKRHAEEAVECPPRGRV
jgi:hypothetical protein